MNIFDPIPLKFDGKPVVVAASGPSLTAEACELIREGHEMGLIHLVAVSDAYKRLPFADILFSSDEGWWRERNGAAGFQGERWSPHEVGVTDKSTLIREIPLNLCHGTEDQSFRLDGRGIHYGRNSGFAACNLALAMGARRLILVGFNFGVVNGLAHYFGDHVEPLRNTSDWQMKIDWFRVSFEGLPSDREIINATPESALTFLPRLSLHEALCLN